jgi:hypothetical protein
MLDGAQHIGCSPAGSNSDQGVSGGEPAPGKVAASGFRIIFRGFGGPRQSRLAASDDSLDQIRRHLKSWRAFGGVQYA